MICLDRASTESDIQIGQLALPTSSCGGIRQVDRADHGEKDEPRAPNYAEANSFKELDHPPPE